MFADLNEYAIAHDRFVEILEKVFGSSLGDFLIEFSEERYVELESFLLIHKEDSYYCIHLDSNTIISWYKSIGRDTMCNNVFTFKDLEDFFSLLKEEYYNK